MKTIKNRAEIGNIANVTYLLRYVNRIENDIADLLSDISYLGALIDKDMISKEEYRLYYDYCERVSILQELKTDISAYVLNARKVWFNEQD